MILFLFNKFVRYYNFVTQIFKSLKSPILPNIFIRVVFLILLFILIIVAGYSFSLSFLRGRNIH